jgi:Carboxypeptidase regulatory-like domain
LNDSRLHPRVFAYVLRQASSILKKQYKTHLQKPSQLKTASFSVALLFSLCFACSPAMWSQATATLSGTITDQSGKVVADADVTLTNEATQDLRVLKTNDVGYYTFTALSPGSYTLKIVAKNFAPKQLTGIVLHGGDTIKAPDVTLAVGSAEESVTVETAPNIIPTESGQHGAVLESRDIQNLALEGRDTTELLKVLPGVTTTSNGLSNGSSFTAVNISAAQSALGSGLSVNGVPNRGGSSLLLDNVSIIDPGNMGGALETMDPEMTEEVSVQSSNFGAETQFGPVVVSGISKSGGADYHGSAYFFARNDALNANDWQDNRQGVGKAGAHYYYPGGNFGGPVPHTQKKLLFWGGYERLLQNQGNANHLTSYIPTPEMMQGDFTNDNPNNAALCPGGFSSTAQGTWCNDLSGTTLPDGTTVTNGHIPAQFLDPGAKALASFWPKANANPATTPGGYNYYQPIININNGWIFRARLDYNFSDSTKFYVSYQQGFSSQFAQGNGAHIYWTPSNSIPYPGGGLVSSVYTKAIAGHFIHVFNNTTTNEFIASWAFANLPTGPSKTGATDKSTLNYPSSYGSVFNKSVLIPSYSSPGNQTFPDFSQGDIFEPSGTYLVRKEVPSFADNLTKVWRNHTFKFGGFTQNTSNLQGNNGTNLNGTITKMDGTSGFKGQNVNVFTGILTGSPQNPVANFIMGNVTGYQESNSAPVSDMAYQVLAFYAADAWKATPRLSLDLGARIEHVGHWYDRQGVGMAVFFPERVASDYFSGKINPGFYWHGIDPGIPLSGQPNRLAFVSPRFGLSYDLFGTGKTIVRGGWGVYRFMGQYNDYAPALTTAQAVQNYNLPNQTSVLLSQIGRLAPASCPTPPCRSVSGTQNGLSPTDYGVPITYAYNFTIDQQLKWNTLLEVAYVGSQSSQILDSSETIEGSNFTALADQNKTPIGAYFQPDPVTGVLSKNPENLSTNPDGTLTSNNAADYRPFGYAYGTAGVYVPRSRSYTNYNGLQASWLKRTGRLVFDFNGTWSRTLGTGLQANPFDLRANYGVEAIDRPFVFNSSYMYQFGNVYHGNPILSGLLNGWAISGITTWQAGGNLLALLGNGIPNFGLTLGYQNIPSTAQKVSNTVGDPTYFGTDAAIAIQPVLTCNPNSGLAKYQRVQLKCFSAPAIGTNGGQKYPYMSMGSYMDNDIAVRKSFTIHEKQKVEFRASAFNWLNHPLPQFSSQNQITLKYLVDYQSKAITLNTGAGGTVNNFGYMDQKTGNPYQRVIELDAKYSF